MDSTRRIVFNTLAQYSRSILNILLSLFSTRYIVEALGISDYGIYVVVGGVVALLGFITNALVITTQRFVSFYYGKADIKQVCIVFANSMFIHQLFALLMATVLLCLKDVIIYHWLKIPAGREIVAAVVYIITIFMLVTTIITAPFKALFIARENIVYISIVEVCDGILKLGIAIWILFTDADRLLLYAYLMLTIQVFNLLAFAGYAMHRYEECRLIISPKILDTSCMKELAGFAGWSTYSAGAIVMRNQGIQILMNRIFGTVINAAFGIAMQVFGSIAFVASSVLNAMNPQIMKAEGEGNRKKMLQLVERESKYSTMLLILVVIPLMFEMPSVLSFWLKEVPPGADMFCRFILCSFILDQSTYGINTAIQATGKIKMYTLLMYTPKILILIPVYYLFQNGFSPISAMWVYIATEALISLARLPYIKHICGLSITHFLTSVIYPLLPLLFVQCIIGYCLCYSFDIAYRFIVTIPLSIVIGGTTLYFFTLNKSERDYAVRLIYSKVKK